MNQAAYVRFELLRTFRNRRIMIFSLGFPIVLYLVIAGPNRNESDFANSGISAPLPSDRSAGIASSASRRSRRASISGRRC